MTEPIRLTRPLDVPGADGNGADRVTTERQVEILRRAVRTLQASPGSGTGGSSPVRYATFLKGGL